MKMLSGSIMAIMNLRVSTPLCSLKGVIFMTSKAQGAPTKDFFVGMLTRDIELSDAILDLLDNCLDGVMRQKKNTNNTKSSDYYSGFFSHISISKHSFVIEDNCGGIPKDVAEKYAFRMGRASTKVDEGLPTVGIYGIGMKRAIFKIGKSAVVYTRNANDLYKVTIPKDWENNETEWDFPMNDLKDKQLLVSGGTKIDISNINTRVSELWGTTDKLDAFVNNLIKSIQQSYSLIIQKGFEIIINGQLINPFPINLLFDYKNATSIKPFLYQQTFEDVHMSLAIGFYAPTPSPEEIDDENNLKRSTSDAGWTIICNDRVVLYNDKTHLTGWGEAGVPQYHTQFIGIRGVVIFESNNPKNLPMTTTKRGIDTSSNIYATAKDKMRQGLKIFTDYTNRWKGQNDQERVYSLAARSIPVDSLIASKEKIEASIPIKFRPSKGGFVFKPNLPKPVTDKPYRRISFSRSIEEINDIIEYLYNDREHEVTPSQVGEKCFEFVLEKSHSTEGE